MNHQSSQFEMRNPDRLTSSLMIFSFGHSLKTSKPSKSVNKYTWQSQGIKPGIS
jgi:hypothetical protein